MRERTIEYVSAGRTFSGFLAEPEAAGADQRPGVLVLHGGSGLGTHERERARMLAALGYVAFAPDLFGEVFETRARGVEVITDLVEQPPRLRQRLADALDRMRAHDAVDRTRVAAIGFCFGGLAALELARSRAEVRCVVAFHGGLTARAPAETGAVRAAILVCTGAADPFVTREHRAGFEDEMTTARADWQMHVYGDALHGFTHREATQPGSRYDELADRRSWLAMRALFDEAMSSAAK